MPGRKWNVLAAAPSGESHAGRVYVDTRALSTRTECDPVVSKWPPDLYPSRFRGPVMSAEIEVLTAALDSSGLILFQCWCHGVAVLCAVLLARRVKESSGTWSRPLCVVCVEVSQTK